MWNGKQIIPAAWIEEATTFKIDQAPDELPEEKALSDWKQGYCYQFWRSRNNAYRADGAFGQYIIVMPEKDAVVAITCESPDLQDEINLVWDHILPAMKEGRLQKDKDNLQKLKERLEKLALPVPAEKPDSPVASAISGKNFKIVSDQGNQGYFNFCFSGYTCHLSLEMNGEEASIVFGNGRWIESETGFPGPSLLSRPLGFNSHRIAAAYEWKDDSTLVLTARYIESPHSIMFNFTFEADTLIMKIRLSPPPGLDTPQVKAVMEE